MYAIIKTGGKQYRVSKDDVIDVELLKKENGEEVTFDEVLLFNDGKSSKIGAPVVQGCSVLGESLGLTKGPKVVAFKYKKRKSFRKKIGHRQKYTRVKIKDIKVA